MAYLYSSSMRIVLAMLVALMSRARAIALRTAASSSSTLVSGGTQPDSICNCATRL